RALAGVVLSFAVQSAAAIAEPIATNGSDASDSTELQRIQRRLDEQAEEIQRLRQELVARGGPPMAETLPDGELTQPDGSKGNISEFEERVNAIEKKLAKPSTP